MVRSKSLSSGVSSAPCLCVASLAARNSGFILSTASLRACQLKWRSAFFLSFTICRLSPSPHADRREISDHATNPPPPPRPASGFLLAAACAWAVPPSALAPSLFGLVLICRYGPRTLFQCVFGLVAPDRVATRVRVASNSPPCRSSMNSHESFQGKVSSLGCLGPYQICRRKALGGVCRGFRKRVEIQYRTAKAEGLGTYEQLRSSVQYACHVEVYKRQSLIRDDPTRVGRRGVEI